MYVLGGYIYSVYPASYSLAPSPSRPHAKIINALAIIKRGGQVDLVM